MFLIHKYNSKTISFLADRALYVMGIIYWIVITISGLFGTILCIHTGNNSAGLIFFFVTIIGDVACLCALPKWRIIVEIDNESICYKPTFKKKIVRKFSDFGYFYCASYTYYTKKKYIVFSQRRLNDYELTHINNVPVSDKLIKIKVRRGLKEVLSTILPPKYLFRIPKDFW